MRESHKMQGLFKQVFQGFVMTGTRVHEGVVNIVPGESEVSQLGEGSQVFSGFLLFHLFQMQDMLDLFLGKLFHLHELIDKEAKMDNLLTVLSQCLTCAHHSLDWKSHGVNLFAHLPFAILGQCIQSILLSGLDILGRRSSFQIWPGHPFCGLRGNQRIGRPWFWRRRATAQLFGSGHGLAFFLDFGHQIAEALRSFERARILVTDG